VLDLIVLMEPYSRTTCGPHCVSLFRVRLCLLIQLRMLTTETTGVRIAHKSVFGHKGERPMKKTRRFLNPSKARVFFPQSFQNTYFPSSHFFFSPKYLLYFSDSSP